MEGCREQATGAVCVCWLSQVNTGDPARVWSGPRSSAGLLIRAIPTLKLRENSIWAALARREKTQSVCSLDGHQTAGRQTRVPTALKAKPPARHRLLVGPV